MKTIQLIKAIVVFITIATAISCVQDDDFSVPDLTIEEPQIEGNLITISALRDLFLQEGDTVDFQDDNLYVEGYVVTSDAAGNWFEELVIQDSPSNPTAGVRILIDDSPLFATYELGRKIFVKLAGLHLGDSNGVLTLGVTNTLEKISAPAQFEMIQRSTEVAEIIPLDVVITDFSEELENIYIRLSDVQILASETIDTPDGIPLSFSGEPTDEFDGERTIISCENNQTAILRTSTFAAFQSIALPTGSGSVSGLLTRDFFGSVYNVVVNDQNDIVFDNPERCDPVEIDCGPATEVGEQLLYEDFFETQSTGQPISGNGWTNYVEEGSETWEAFSSSGASPSLGVSARVGSFNSGDDLSVAWLITPEINFDTQEGETLRFLTSNSFADSSTLELVISSNWDGTPENIPFATWDILIDAFIVGENDDFTEWFPSGDISLDCITGTAHIGFRYVGRDDEQFDGTYELDEIQINAN